MSRRQLASWAGNRRLQRALHGGARATGGNAAVEFALVAPVLILILLGILAFGVYFGIAHSVQQLASEAARAAVSGLTLQERSQLAQGMIDRSIGNYGLLQPSALTVRSGFESADPNLFTVTLSYDLSGIGLQHLAGLVSMPGDTLVRSATIRRGGV